MHLKSLSHCQTMMLSCSAWGLSSIRVAAMQIEVDIEHTLLEIKCSCSHMLWFSIVGFVNPRICGIVLKVRVLRQFDIS